MKRCRVTVEGDAPLLMHNVNCMAVKKPPDLSHDDWEVDPRHMRAKSYLIDERVVLPPRVLLGHLIRASKSASAMGIKPPRKKSWTDTVKSSIFVDDPGLDLGIEFKDVGQTQSYVTIQRGKILRVWPMLQKGWNGSFSFIIMDEKVMDTDTVLSLLDFGGKFCGIGDYRPQMGRYTVTDFEAENVK